MTLAAPSLPVSRTHQPLAAGESLPDAAFACVRRKMVLECCKWDPQVGDVSTLASFPLFIDAAEWREVCALAEQLAVELSAAERELLGRPDLWRRLAIPRRLRRILLCAADMPQPMRVCRFDFHWTKDGWRISEVNSDVPGGYAEASAFPRLMAEALGDDDARPTGDPATAWGDAFDASVAPKNRNIALLAAPGFMEDQQVVGYLARVLAERGFTPRLTDARSVHVEDFGAVVRFYQAEWLARFPRRICEPLLFSNRTPVINPGFAVLSESKRFPLVWNELRTPLPSWRRLLPETRELRDAPWRSDDGWLIKTALCNTGDTVCAPDLVNAKRWRAARRSAWMFPQEWVAQRRFETLPVETPAGERMYPCVGVYTVNGRSAGAYVRLSRGQVCDYRAVDAALFVGEGGV